jgi:hypothetical protein
VSDQSTPTPEGLRRWPHTQGYHPDLSASATRPDPSLPCTCTPVCAPRCAGECGCRACDLAFVVFCDEAGLTGSDGLVVTEAEALARYRGA